MPKVTPITVDHVVFQSLLIPIRLPGLNEMLAGCRQARGRSSAYAIAKNDSTAFVARLCKAQGLVPMSSGKFRFFWHERTRRRNPDNIAAGKKFILDGLVQAGILPNDGWSEVVDYSDVFIHGVKDQVYVEMEGPAR